VRLFVLTGFRQIAMLDRDVDPLGHGDRLSPRDTACGASLRTPGSARCPSALTGRHD
jgi:hypothetical protein